MGTDGGVPILPDRDGLSCERARCASSLPLRLICAALNDELTIQILTSSQGLPESDPLWRELTSLVPEAAYGYSNYLF